MGVRVGIGYDIHELKAGESFLLGGVEIDFHKGPAGHSDADVLIHAIIDALLGAANLADIGTHFPDDSAQYQGISSLVLLDKVRTILSQSGYRIVNIDSNVILEEPELRQYIDRIRGKISSQLGLNIGQVSVKAKSNEGLDAVGAGAAIVAQAIVLLEGNEL